MRAIVVATVTIHEAKTHLSRLIERARQGEEIVIAKGKEPVVRLTPVTAFAPRVPGAWKGLMDISRIEEPMTEEELAEWSGEP